MYSLASLGYLRRHLGLATADTAEDARLMEALRVASAQIERAAGRRFLPRYDTIIHRGVGSGSELLLEDDLLELLAVEDAAGEIPLSEVTALPEQGAASLLRLKNGRFFTAGESGVKVTGVWGWHDDWNHAWLSSGDGVMDNPLSPTTNEITVEDADGEDGLLETPRFQPGQLLLLDQEYVQVVSVNSVTNKLRVQRGVAGTPYISHERYAPLFVYQPPRDVRDLTVRWASLLYKQGSPVSDDFYKALTSLRRIHA